MTMVVDANYLLRWFLDDVPEQARQAAQLLETSASATLTINSVTLAELTYVLRGKGYDHHQIYQVVEEIYTYPSIIAPHSTIRSALEIYRDTSLDFEDCLLVALHRIEQYAIATFDKQLLKMSDTSIVHKKPS